MRWSRSCERALSWVSNPAMPLLFILGGIVLGVMGNSAYGLLILWLGDSPWVQVVVILACLLVVLVVGFVLQSFLLRRPAPATLGPEELAEPRRGLVLFLSPGEGRADETALAFHGKVLRSLWLIATDEVWKEGKVGQLQCEHGRRGVEVDPRRLRRPHDNEESYRLVREILGHAARLGLGPDDLYVDITGCLRPAAIGATRACLESGYDLEYVLPQFDADGHPRTGSGQVMQVPVRPAGTPAAPGR